MVKVLLGDKMHEINLASYRLRTDLAIDSKIDKNKDNYIRNDITKDIYVEEVIIKDKEEEKKYHRSIGIYKTICFKDITDTDNFEMVLNTFSNTSGLAFNLPTCPAPPATVSYKTNE